MLLRHPLLMVARPRGVCGWYVLGRDRTESNLKRTSSGGPICLLSAGESGSRQDLAAGSSSAW